MVCGVALYTRLERSKGISIVLKAWCMENNNFFSVGACIRVPRDTIDDRTLINLSNLINNKDGLLKMALNADCVDVDPHRLYIDFPWFHKRVSKQDVELSFLVILHLIQHAADCYHISATCGNKKRDYCRDDCEEFLSQLGFIGDSYLETRERICSRFPK